MKKTAKRKVPAKKAAAAKPTAPPAKLYDPMLGDKTPAVVAWYREHDPDEYKRRYQNRKLA